MCQGGSGKASSLLKMVSSELWLVVCRSDAWNCCNHLVILRRPGLDAIPEPLNPPSREPALSLGFLLYHLLLSQLRKMKASDGPIFLQASLHFPNIWEADNFLLISFL